jgi:hypothetical protein
MINVLTGFLLLFASVLAGTAVAETPQPVIHEPSDNTLKCIQPEDEMRRNHMKYILHQRDLTMHQGIRTETDSLAKCIDCHVEPNEKGEIAGIESDEHFCNACHQYASVQIDCFQCHADRPQQYIKRDALASSHSDQSQQTLATQTTEAEEVNQ